MAREIAEQPEALRRTLDALLPLRDEIAARAAGRRIALVARGSSDNACVYARYLAEIHAGVAASLAAPSLATLYGARVDLSDTVAVCVSQSGSTTEIVESLEWAKSCGAVTIAVTNDAASPLAAAADLALVTRAGVELAVPATKSFTTQVAALAVLVDALAPVPGTLDAELARVPDVAEELLGADSTALDAIVERLSATDEVLVSGRGLAYGTTLEVGLKLEETCLRPVRGLSYADLKHGPVAVLDADLVTVLVAGPSGPTLPGLVDLAGTARAAGSTVIGFGGDEEFRRACDLALAGPMMNERVAPITAVIRPQLVVERLARRLGLDPDHPRGLRKVTQTD